MPQSPLAKKMKLKPESILWISFPKGTSKIQTDLKCDEGWDAIKEPGLKWVYLISINDTWSAFALRPFKAGECGGKEQR